MKPGFELQGHRGARGLFPENTLEGFAAAIALGVRSLELDVAVTADDVAVVTHDPELNRDIARGADGAWLAAAGPAIRALTLAELRRYDVGRLRPGSPTALAHPRQMPCDGARIPTLADIFAHTASSGACIDAEIKTLPHRPELTVSPAAMADAIVAVAEAAGALDRLVIRSFDWRGLHHLQRSRPDIGLVWLTSPSTAAQPGVWWDGAAPHQSVPQAVAATGGRHWAPDHASLTQASIADAHALGLRVLPWTVNDPADMARLIAWGVDGLCTDRPDLARAVVEAG